MTLKSEFSLIRKDTLKGIFYMQLFGWCLMLLIGYIFNMFMVAIMLLLLSFLQFASFLLLIVKSNRSIEKEFIDLQDKYVNISTNQHILYNKRSKKKNGN